MTQQNLRELLKQGDPKAIASSINRTLKPKGINADVTRDNGCLHIILESDKVPSQMALVDFIRSGMTNLGVESIHTVKVYGRRTGDGSAAWEEEIDLMPPEPMLYASDTAMPDDSVGLDDVEPDSEDYYQEAEFDRDDEDNDEEDEDEDIAPPPKKQFPKWAIPVGILVPLGVIAALYLTGNLPFVGGSTPEPSTPEAASPPAQKATSPASQATSPSPRPSGGPQAASPTPKATPSAAAPASPAPTSPAPKAVSASPAPKAASASPAPKTAPTSPAPKTAPTSPAPKAASPAAKAVAPKPDSWREAVNNAQKAAILAQTAQSQKEWIVVASEWQKAIQLMRAVPSTSPNHEKAQQKAAEYQANLIVANRRAAAAP
jgi:hypothetical protein